MSVAVQDTRKAIGAIIAVSVVAILFLFWLIYFKAPSEQTLAFVGMLPAVNATLNALSASCLVAGLVYIKKKKIHIHKRFMLGAFVFSALFLISYVVYHNFHGDTPFTGTGAIRPVYFFILISHIVLSIFALPLALTTLFFSWQENFDKHRRIAKITLPLWLYVSVTGVVVFFMLKYLG